MGLPDESKSRTHYVRAGRVEAAHGKAARGGGAG